MILVECFLLFILIKTSVTSFIKKSNEIPESVALINFGLHSDNEVSWYLRPNECGDYHVYDKIAKKCRRIYCRTTNGDLAFRKCTVKEAFEGFFNHKEFIDIEAEKWTIQLFAYTNKSNFTGSRETFEKLESLLAERLKISSDRIDFTQLKVIDDGYCVRFDIELAEDIGETTTNQQIITAILNLTYFDRSLLIDHTIIYISNVKYNIIKNVRSFCEGEFSKRLTQWGLNFTITESNQLINNENGRIYPRGSYLASLIHDNFRVVKFALLCEKVTGLYCDAIKLSAGSYEFLNNGSYVKSINGITDKFEVDFNSTVKICEQASFFFIDNETENAIVGVCLIVSCIFLVLILITFAMIPDVSSTLPGFNTINLVATILVLQLIFLTGSFWHYCWLSAIIMHYFILLNFSWSSIIGFHVFRTFATNESMRRHDNKTGSRFTSFVMAHLMVIIVIGISLINEFAYNDFAPHFGPFQGVCWISSSVGVLFYFAVPVSVSNSFSIICYLASYITIRRTLNESVAVSTNNRPSNRSIPTQLSVFSRIATALSICWLTILIIPMTPRNSIASILIKHSFVFINTNQGLLLFLAFLWNKRVAFIWLKWAKTLFRVQKAPQNSLTTITTNGINMNG